MAEFANGWELSVDVSPEWLFFVLCRNGAPADLTPPLAEYVWSIAEKHSVYQFVLELGTCVALSSHLVGQLVLLHKRSCQHGGKLRVCGFTKDNQEVLHVMNVAPRFPNYRTREDAVLGHC